MKIELALPISVYEVVLSSGTVERISASMHDDYTQSRLFSELEDVIRRRHPGLETAIVSINFPV